MPSIRINAAANIVGLAAPLLANIIAARLLIHQHGAEGYGVVTLCTAVLALASAFDLALDLIVTRRIAEDLGRGEGAGARGVVLAALVWYAALAGGCGLLLGTIASPLAHGWLEVPAQLAEEATACFRFTALLATASILLAWSRACLQGSGSYPAITAVSVSNAAGGTALGLWWSGAIGIDGFMAGRAAVAAAAAGVGLLLVLHRHRAPGPRGPWFAEASAAFRRFAPWGFTLRLTGYLTSGLDRTLIGLWTGLAAAGSYGVAAMLVSATAQFVGSAAATLLPVYSSLAGGGRHEELRRLAHRSFRLGMAVSVVAHLHLACMGERFIALWVSPAVAAEIRLPLLLLASASAGQLALVGVVNVLVVGTDRLRGFTMYSSLRSGLLAVALAVAVPDHGLVGAGVAMLVPLAIDLLYARRALRPWGIADGDIAGAAFGSLLAALVVAPVAWTARLLATDLVTFILVNAALFALWCGPLALMRPSRRGRFAALLQRWF